MRLRKMLGIIFVAFILLVIVIYTVNRFQHQAYLREVERVNVIRLQGTIEESQVGWGSLENITPRSVERKLERAAEDVSIKAVVLRINSPGGSVAASQEIADLIRNFEKPLVVSMGDMAASGGYYISASAPGIVAQPGTMTGSIGVLMMMVNPRDLLENIGIELQVIKSGEHKDIFQRELTPEERRKMQDLSDAAYEQFVTAVARGRDLDREEVRELATGEMFVGSQALELGLVDRLGGVDEAVQYAAEIGGLEEPVQYEFTPPGIIPRLRDLAVQLPRMIRTTLFSGEIAVLEELKRSLPREPRYEIR